VYVALYSLRAEGYWLWNIGEKMLSILFPNPFIVLVFKLTRMLAELLCDYLFMPSPSALKPEYLFYLHLMSC